MGRDFAKDPRLFVSELGLVEYATGQTGPKPARDRKEFLASQNYDPYPVHNCV